MLSKFVHYAKELVDRHRRKIICRSYFIGDGTVAVIPPIKAGFLETIATGTPDWHLLVSSYGDRPLPLISSLTLLFSSTLLEKKLAIGMAGEGLGCALIIYDLATKGDVWSAIALSPAIIGAAFGALHTPLEKRFGDHPNKYIRGSFGMPERMAGVFFGMTSIPAIATSIYDGNGALFVSGVTWTIGNLTLWTKPKDKKSADETSPQCPGDTKIVPDSKLIP